MGVGRYAEGAVPNGSLARGNTTRHREGKIMCPLLVMMSKVAGRGQELFASFACPHFSLPSPHYVFLVMLREEEEGLQGESFQGAQLEKSGRVWLLYLSACPPLRPDLFFLNF